jgi:hypothetical protein
MSIKIIPERKFTDDNQNTNGKMTSSSSFVDRRRSRVAAGPSVGLGL